MRAPDTPTFKYTYSDQRPPQSLQPTLIKKKKKNSNEINKTNTNLSNHDLLPPPYPTKVFEKHIQCPL